MEKRVSDSFTEQVHILSQGTLNGYNRLFGGQLMSWIDVVAAVVARRHSERNVTTAVVDMIQFQAPAYANDTILILGKIVYAGRTSMEIKVTVYVEELSGERKLINTAYVVMVALDDYEKPTLVPGLILETEEDKIEYENAKIRKARRLQYKTHQM
ncbi:MAG: acyl-CoA thioesterase [Eubacteriales bacterium]|nr:acyl-CoA thioesterase [Eubacteriales bacterium]